MSDEKRERERNKDQRTMLGTGKTAAPVGSAAGDDDDLATGNTMLGSGTEPQALRPAPQPRKLVRTIRRTQSGSQTTQAPPDERGSQDQDTPASNSIAAVTEGAPTLAGSVYCGYHLGEKIAEGGMGVVYRGEHAQIGRRAAIKILKPEYCTNQEVVARFLQEARAVNSIRHENIVDIFDLGHDDGARVVMELLDGESLADTLQGGALPWVVGRRLLDQTLRALHAAHEKGFAHRDLKPDNIFLRLSKEGHSSVRLLDFGIAKLMGAGEKEGKLTRTGSIMGTPHYMSPEQINGAGDIDRRTDLYSLGVIAFEMFNGKRPFGGETMAAIIKEHLLTEPPRLEPSPELEVPEGFADIVARMLVKDVAERYQTASEILADLADLANARPLTHAGAAAAATTAAVQQRAAEPKKRRPTEHREEAPRGRSRTPWMVAAAAVAMAAVVAFVVVAVRKPEMAEPQPQSSQAQPTPRDTGTQNAATTATNTATENAPTHTATTRQPPPAEPAWHADEVRIRARQLLTGALGQSEPGFRAQAADGLGDVKDKQSVPELAGLIGKDPDDEVRGRVAGALGRIGDQRGAAPIRDAYPRATPPLAVWYDQALIRLGEEKARARLKKAARSKDLAVSFKAALALADISAPGDKEAVSALTTLAKREAELNDIAPYAGVMLLGRLAALRNAVAEQSLIDALKQPDEGVRVAAAEALARVGDEHGKPILLAILRDGKSPNRLPAARALTLLGDYSGFELLSEKLGDGNAEVRRQAARGLGDIGENSSVAQLLPRLQDDNMAVRISAAVALLAIVGLDPALLAQASVDWARAALASEDWAARQAAARTIGDIPAKDAVPLLAQAVVDREPKVRQAAARSARKLHNPEAAGHLARAAAVEKDKVVQEEQVRSLAVMKEPATKETLTAIAAEKGKVGVLASGALVALGDLGAVEALEDAIKSADTGTRQAAAESAVLASDPIAVPTLGTGVKDKSFAVRFASAEGLASYLAEKDAALPVLREGLISRDAGVQGRAHAALTRFGEASQQGMSPAEMLDSPAAATRLAAIPALRAMSWEDAGIHLRRAVTDANLEVRRAAVEALAGFAAANRDQVAKVYKSLVQDGDPVTRAMAQAQLARLIEQKQNGAAGNGQSGADSAPAPTGDIEALKKAMVEVVAARVQVNAAREKLDGVLARIEKNTAASAETEEQVDQVASLANEVAHAAEEVVQARALLQGAIGRAEVAGAGVDTPEGAALKKELASHTTDGAEIARAAINAAKKARERAKQFAEEETADPELYLTSARTSIATGKLREAQRDLKKAEKIFAKLKRSNPEVHFAYGELYYKLAQGAANPKDKIKLLTRSKAGYDRFAGGGFGFRTSQARERSQEIAAELKELEAAPPAPPTP